MKPRHAPVHQIELRIAALADLFNSMDPTPFHHRDLDRDAVEFLESWALEFPRNSHFRIVIHVETMPAEDPTPLVSEAIAQLLPLQVCAGPAQLEAAAH